jgi:hypothetical protein
MLFQVIHSHSLETCPARSIEAAKRSAEWWQNLKKSPTVKVLSGTVSPLDHTFYITIEADDYATLTKALGPLVSIGTGDIIPVLTLDQAFPMAEAGAFRAAQ